MAGCRRPTTSCTRSTDADFAAYDAAGARRSRAGRGRAGLAPIIYLGRLGDDDRRPFPPTCAAAARSRRCSVRQDVPMIVIRAGIIVVGDGELPGRCPPARRPPARHDHPGWVNNPHPADRRCRHRRFLLGVLALPAAPATSSTSGDRRYCVSLDHARRVAATRASPVARSCPSRCSPPAVVPVRLALVTDVDAATGRALVDSMTNEVVVRDHSIRDLIPFDPMPYDDAVRKALSERAQAKRAGR